MTRTVVAVVLIALLLRVAYTIEKVAQRLVRRVAP